MLKDLIWMGSSLKDIREFPEEVKDEIGFALHVVQEGCTPKSAKILKGLNSSVFEIVCDYNTDTYRTIYAVKINASVYVLHAFKKKSNKGITTPKRELALIQKRFQMAKDISNQGN